MKRTITRIAWAFLALFVVMYIAGIVLNDTYYTVPELAKLPGDDVAENSRVFNDRIQTEFPIGTQTEELIQTLKANEFTISPEGNQASYSKHGAPCITQWFVHWQAEDERVREIKGRVGLTCP